MRYHVGVAVEYRVGETTSSELIAVAEEVHRRGFTRLSLMPPVRTAAWDPIVPLGVLGARVPGLALGVIGYPINARQVVLVAKQFADLSVLHRSEMRIGIDVLDPCSDDSCAQVELLRALWSQPLVTQQLGPAFLDRVALVPRPDQPPEVWAEISVCDIPLVDSTIACVDGWLVRSNGDAAAIVSFGECLRTRRSCRADLVLADPDVACSLDEASLWFEAGGTHATFAPPGPIDLVAIETLASELVQREVRL